MKLKRILPLMLIVPLAACGKKGKEEPVNKGDLIIPDIDVESMTINLPTKPVYNTGTMKSDDTYDYIDLYEVSDFHGAVNFRSGSEGAYLGLSKLSTYLKGKRALNEGGTLVLSSGDMFQGSAESNLTKGFMVNYAMQYMGFDAMAIGNHEFDWTDAWLKKNANLKYNTSSDPIPYLGANVYKKGTTELPDFLKASTIVERNGYKIGIIGTIGDELESSILASNVANYTFEAEAEIVAAEAARLRSEESCNAVVWLAHEGLEEIPIVEGVDAIFGGHAHEDKLDVQATPKVATRNYGRSVAHIGLKFNKTTKACSYVDNSAKLETFSTEKAQGIADDTNVSAIIHEYDSEVNKVKNIRLASTDVELEYNGVLKNICTETVFETAVNEAKAHPESGIDPDKIVCSFHNVNGGIRDNIKPGEITYGSVYAPFPFDNEVVLVKIKGSLLIKNLRLLSNLGCYRTFKDSSLFMRDGYYYIATTDFCAFSTSDSGINGRIKSEVTEADLTHTGKIVRDEVAKKIYKLDKIDPSRYANTMDCFKSIPQIF